DADDGGGRARTGRRRVRVPHRRRRGRWEGACHPPPRACQATRQRLHRRGQGREEPGRREGLRPPRALVRRAGDAPSRRIWQAMRRSVLVGAAATISAVVLAFLILPVVALFTYQPVHDLVDGFGSKAATDAI